MFTSLKRSFRQIVNPQERRLTPEEFRDQKAAFLERLDVQKGEWFFVSPYGIGDLCIILSLLPEFRKVHKARNISVGIVKENHKDLLPLFPGSADRFVLLDKKELDFCTTHSFASGKPLLLHPEHIYPTSMHSLIGYKGFTLLDVYKLLMDLPIECPTVGPSFPGKEIARRAIQRFRDYGLEDQKTILMAPDAFSYRKPFVSRHFWEKLVREGRSRGFKVAMMSIKPELNAIDGVTPVQFPLSEALPFLNQCGYLIGNRSGFCDLVASIPTTNILLYSKEKWHAGTLLEGSSLKRMGMAGENSHELEADSTNHEDLLPRILDIIKET